MARRAAASRRAAEEAAERMRQEERRRRVRLGTTIGVLALVLVAALVGWTLSQRDRTPVAKMGSQVDVPHRASGGAGISAAPTPAEAPTLVVYEDYQCPGCRTAHDAMAPAIEELVEQKKLGVEVRSLDFMDERLGNDASTRANVAAACADVQGRYTAYRDEVFANQSSKKGVGYGDDQLRDQFARAADVPDLPAFQLCYDESRTHDVVHEISERAAKDKINSTPQYRVLREGQLSEPLDLQALFADQRLDADELAAAVEQAR
ncbi:DsbA family protein [Luteococcus sp. OSA5]|uniref:DsbA family protein n=1 Tax=Luteococcus sp. OSA5 TaxID=3401630 RepID=UPI003B43B265